MYPMFKPESRKCVDERLQVGLKRKCIGNDDRVGSGDHETIPNVGKKWQQLPPCSPYRGDSSAEDLYDMNPKEGTQYCEQLWNDAIEKVRRPLNKNVTLSVWRLLWLCFGLEYARAAIFKVSWLIGVILEVYILKALVKVVEDEHDFKWWWSSLLVIGMFSMSALVSVSRHMCFSLSQKVGMKLRSTMSMAVFRKLLSIKLFSLVGTNTGFLLNLVTNDSQKLLDAATNFHFVWFMLIDLSVISTLAIVEIGASAVPGVILAFFTQPLQVWMAYLGARLRIKAIKYTDSRVHLTGEVLNGIRIIKYNGWIAPFLRRIQELRHLEINGIKRASLVRATTSTIRDSFTPLASLATFGTYLAIHKGTFMSPSQAFTVLALFNVLVRSFAAASVGFQTCGEAIVAVHRLQKLLNMDRDAHFNLLENKVSRDFPEKAVVLKNCSFCWMSGQKKVVSNEGTGKVHIDVGKENGTNANNIGLDLFPFGCDQSKADVVLRNIYFSVAKGELVSIFGPVGSGKSSLLLGILGEMQCLRGQKFALHNIAYVPQQPWILNNTIRQNIVFTSPFDPEQYRRTIAACALEHDISLFAGGHDTEIGDKGINLSGGQKARISLARACYSTAPIVFLDDPLAAVDVATAKHLIKHVLKGVLKGRTIVLITHNKSALHICDKVYFMKNGSLQEDEGFKRVNPSTYTSNLGEQTEVDALMHVGVNENSKTAEKILTNMPKPFNLRNSKEKGRSTVNEDRVIGSVQASTVIAYAKASGFSFSPVLALNFDCFSAKRLPGSLGSEPNYLQNVSGRILNRFSKDQALVDETLPTTAQAGVVIVQGMQVTGYIQFAVRQAAEVENYLTSVERINAYTSLATEAAPNTAPGVIEEDWPSRGEVEFVKYTMTYRVDLTPVLNEVSFKIQAKEKIGILGRTGVGKSSLAAALFRMVENERCGGDIFIDDINIKFVGLDDLRQRLSIIPQDPILFQGSVRFNLDPFEAYTDVEIYEALERVHLLPKIQVMDEATAAIDGETDTLIQRTIKTTFQHCTLLTIAHRIDTVIDCDRVLILAAGGLIAEFDSPHKLLNCNNQG
ncbi:hypothetical protein L7F22_022399 [Adiantum nelumboides]|nr:hypothetical protein [Adiantum nelumboides]